MSQSSDTIDVTAKLSYLERFQNRKTDIDKLEERLGRLEQIEMYASKMLSSTYLYNVIGQGMVTSLYMLFLH